MEGKTKKDRENIVAVWYHEICPKEKALYNLGIDR